MTSFYKQQLNDWVATLDVVESVVLDIGGAQSPIKGRTRTWDVEDYKIVDLAVPHSDSPAPDIVQDMNEPTPHDLQADLIFMLGVMDYVISPDIALQNLAKFLKPDGEAWVEWPFVYPTHNPIWDEGCRYSEGCLNRLCEKAGLVVQETIYKRPRPGNTLLLQFYSADGMRAARGYDHNVTGFITRLTK